MKKILNNSYLNLILRLIIGMIFLMAAVSKAADPSVFAKEIANYKIIPDILGNFMAITLPWVELIFSIFLIAGIRLKSSALVISIMIIVFNSAIIIAMAKGLNINCGCHTQVMSEQVGWKKLIENFGLMFAAIIVYFSTGYKLTLENYILKRSALSRMAMFRNLN